MRTLLANATVITMNPARDVLDADILIENGVIADMGPGLAGRPENAGAERVDLSGRIVIPGLIQCLRWPVRCTAPYLRRALLAFSVTIPRKTRLLKIRSVILVRCTA